MARRSRVGKDGSVSLRLETGGGANQKIIRAFCVAIAIALAGCGKTKSTTPAVALNGVSIDLPKLQRAFDSSNPPIRESLDRVRLSIRYADFRTALAELAKLANNPDITEAQKKTINDISEQVKQAFAKATPNTANNAAQ